MRRATLIAHAALLALTSVCARAAELSPFLENGALGARIRDLPFPKDLPKDLTSGLTRRVLVRVELLTPSRAPSRRAIEITVKYDLWDETFRFTLAVEERVVSVETHASLDAVLAQLNDARLPSLFPVAGLAPDVTHTLRAEVLLNPIDGERMEEIRKWVAQNSTYAPGRAGGPETNSSAATPNALFNRIFEQYTAEAGAAAWRETLVSKPFNLAAVPAGRP